MNFSIDQARHFYSKDISHNIATIDTSDFSESILLVGSKLMVEVDVSKGWGFINFQKSIDGVNWFQPYDISILLDASCAKTSYMKEFKDLTPFSYIKATIELAGVGVLTGIKLSNPYEK